MTLFEIGVSTSHDRKATHIFLSIVQAANLDVTYPLPSLSPSACNVPVFVTRT